MAKTIKDKSGNIIGYKPGIIYDLGSYDISGKRTPFYVGETTDKDERYKAHSREGKEPKPDAEDKYHHIKKLNEIFSKLDLPDNVISYLQDSEEIRNVFINKIQNLFMNK